MATSVLTYLERSMSSVPDKVAFSDELHSVTYAEVWSAAKHIASCLIAKHTDVNRPIAVIIDRNVESICAFMGILLSRNFYVPIDVQQPIERIKTILGQMAPISIISLGNIPNDLYAVVQIPVYEYADLVKAPVDEDALTQRQTGRLDIDPCYAICTSGSTGVPKGVLVSHRSVLDFIPVFVKTFGFDDKEIFGNQAPFDFDVSVKDIYSTLYCSASMHVIPRKCFAMPKLLVGELASHEVTTLIWAVSALCIVAGINAFKHEVPTTIKKVLFSGETMPVKMLNIWRDYLPDVTYVNLYGPTEITCNCTYYVIDREFAATEKLPLGIPFENEEVLFLNDQNEPIKPGETGEICVCGTCLALGYYRNPERTAAAFVQNPLNDSYPQLMYRTGDLAELGEDGQYYFAARKDFQIKHMGHRIELEEIETHLNAIDGVVRASCLFDDRRNKIVACYAGNIDKKTIISALKLNLPKYMIPNVFIQLEALPLNKNGKIDRQALRKIYFQS